MICQTIRSSHSSEEHVNQSDGDTCYKVFVDILPIVQNSKTKILNDTCTCQLMETEPVNQGMDALEDESQAISNFSSETSDMFPDSS